MSVAFEIITPDWIPFHMVFNILLAHYSKEDKCPCSQVLAFLFFFFLLGWEWDTGAKGENILFN